MSPICQKEGCYMFRSNSPERAECEKNCRLSGGSRKSVRKAPRRKPKRPTTHWGTGQVVERGDIPPWRGKPQGAGPWERTACGAFIKVGARSTSKDSVTCNLCRKTHLWRDD